MEEQSVINLRRGYALMGEQSYADAADVFYRAEQENPRDPMPHVLYGSALYWLGEPEKAGDEFDEALCLDPKNAMAFQLRGIVRARAGQYKDALSDFLSADKADPDRADVKMNAGSVYEATGDTDHALEYFRDAAELDAANPLYRYQLGMLYSRLGRYGEAEEQLSKAVSLFSGYEDALLELAVLKERDGDLPGAIKLYRRAISIKPRDSVARFRLAWALRKAGRAGEAAGALDGAFLLAPANEKGGISMGMAYAGGRKKEAQDQGQDSPFASALKKIPAGQSARIVVELLETPKAALTASGHGEKMGGKLESVFRKPKVSYTKREYFLPAASQKEREKKAAEIAGDVDKLMKGVSPANDVRFNFDIETGPPASAESDDKKKAMYNPHDVGNDMGLWVMGDNWLDNVSEAMDEMDAATPGQDLNILRGLGYLLLGEHEMALDEFSGDGVQAALGRSAALVEAGSEKKALAECLAALRLDPANKTALANKAWLGGGK
jgi:tetratricopeptide (TPR) repeat protein